MSSVFEDQSFAVRLLTAHIRQGHIAHTYLFSGTDPKQKQVMARAFASALNCKEDKVFEPCSCPACHRIASDLHPDVRWLGLEPQTKSIKIDEIRDLRNVAALKPYEGKWKVFIVNGGDRLTEEAQNALLKTLEEPPAETVFCLLVENKSHLFETIRSRSFEVRLRPVRAEGMDSQFSGDEIRRALRQGNWEDFFAVYQTAHREQIKTVLDALMGFFNNRLKDSSLRSVEQVAMIKAFDRLCETKEALEDNVNQKLALSRLIMKLRNTTPVSMPGLLGKSRSVE
ncbi:MAG: hypothetical protein NC930_01530 [Candidatus Omnitrophica bacterium]|nr:hypothetical protein [Candidatus Omnitrophota bacterium]